MTADTDTILEEIKMSLTVAKGSFFKRPEFGHRFRELRNARCSETTRKKCEAYAKEALQWLVDYKHLRTLSTTATIVKDGVISVWVEGVLYTGKTVSFKRFVEVSDVN